MTLLIPRGHNKLDVSAVGTPSPVFPDVAARWVLRAASKDAMRPGMTGLDARFDSAGRWALAATDGHRLHVAYSSDRPKLSDCRRANIQGYAPESPFQFAASSECELVFVHEATRSYLVASYGDPPPWDSLAELTARAAPPLYLGKKVVMATASQRESGKVLELGGVLLNADYVEDALSVRRLPASALYSVEVGDGLVRVTREFRDDEYEFDTLAVVMGMRR